MVHKALQPGFDLGHSDVHVQIVRLKRAVVHVQRVVATALEVRNDAHEIRVEGVQSIQPGVIRGCANKRSSSNARVGNKRCIH